VETGSRGLKWRPIVYKGGGAFAWTLDLPAHAGPLAIADVHGDGTARIIVGCADGRVYGIGPASAG